MNNGIPNILKRHGGGGGGGGGGGVVLGAFNSQGFPLDRASEHFF